MGYRARNGQYYSRKETPREYRNRKNAEAAGEMVKCFVGGAIGIMIWIAILF